MRPNLTGTWKLIRGESDFGFLPPPELRVDQIVHQDPQFHMRTRQKDASGDVTVDRELTIGGEAAEITIRGRVRWLSARWDDAALVVETKSEVSGNLRRTVDRWTLDDGTGWLTIERLHEQTGGPVRQRLRMRREPAQESVWNYPRPPRAEPCRHRVRVEWGGEVIADSTRAWRLLETSHPPAYYIPPADVRMELLEASRRRSFCEFKGEAAYWDIRVAGRKSRDAAWSYPSPSPPYAMLRDHLAFYPSRVDACFVGEERVTPQAGNFYGGWITSNIVGPFKGGPGTSSW